MGTLIDLVQSRIKGIDEQLAGLSHAHIDGMRRIVQKDFGWKVTVSVDFLNRTIYMTPETEGAVIKVKTSDKIDKYLDSLPKMFLIPDWKVSFARPESANS